MPKSIVSNILNGQRTPERKAAERAAALIVRRRARRIEVRRLHPWQEIKAICARDCGVDYHPIAAGDYDYDIRSREGQAKVFEDGTPGGRQRITDRTVRECRAFVRDLVESAPHPDQAHRDVQLLAPFLMGLAAALGVSQATF